MAASESGSGGYDTWLVPQRHGAAPPDHLASAATEGNGIALTKAQLSKLLTLLDGPTAT